MMPEKLLVPFTDKGKQVSFNFFLELILELKTGTERRAQDQWGLGLKLVQVTLAVLCVDTQRHPSEIL